MSFLRRMPRPLIGTDSSATSPVRGSPSRPRRFERKVLYFALYLAHVRSEPHKEEKKNVIVQDYQCRRTCNHHCQCTTREKLLTATAYSEMRYEATQYCVGSKTCATSSLMHLVHYHPVG
ncbi:hypothetical protein BJV82DRAFT_582394 [Fennellomyces sp. T-0311]|nr:hypothetical protein BJV82DRAFT_582394 [Fennellomyces sp. T-0311]